MKNIILILFLFISSFSYPQNSWIATGEMSTGNTDFVYSMTSNSNGDLFASSWAIGIYKSTNNGLSWNHSGLTGKRVSYLTVAPNGDIYGLSKTVDFSYIHKSTDMGETWSDVFTGSYPLNYAGGGSIVFPSDGSIVAAFAVTVGPLIGNVSTFIFKSTNGGNNWFQTQQIGLGFVGGMAITADNKILIGTSLGGVFYSTNNGNSFIQLNTFPPIFIKTILKAHDNSIYVSDAFGLNRSTDNGLTWIDVGGQNSTSYLRAAGLNRNGDLFISTDDRKIFQSVDNGNNWSQINKGMPVNSLVYCFTSANGKMYAGTSNSGAFVYDITTSISSFNNTKVDFKLEQNYPNPFNPKTKIKFYSNNKKPSNVKFIIYNSLGKIIKSLVYSKLQNGEHEIEFDGSDLPSGIYFYKLVSGDFMDVKSMILIK